MNERVITGKIALGDLIELSRRAAQELEVQDARLSLALSGAAAEVELSTYELADAVPC